jgi:uncharacterized protein YjbI with pentapeptide repeats
MNHYAKHSIYKDAINLSGAFIRRTNLRGVNLSGANLSAADCSFADFTGADFRDADLSKTVLKGAILTDVKNLTQEQLSSAITDTSTILPSYLK